MGDRPRRAGGLEDPLEGHVGPLCRLPNRRLGSLEEAENDLVLAHQQRAHVPDRPAAGGEALTETERRLAELAASGLSNQEVAARAYVSVKTVEANLTRVYRKLGVRSRVGLANALREAGGESAQA